MSFSSIEARIRLWAEFLAPGAAPGFLYMVDMHQECADRPLPWPSNAAARVEWALRRYGRMLERMERVPDDTVPFLDLYTGTEIFGEALGCPVYRPEFDMPCAKPFIESAKDVARIKAPELASSSLAYLFDMADELRRRGGVDVPLRIVDIQTPMDIVATMWDKRDFYTVLLLEPEAVRDLAAIANGLLCDFLDEWFTRYGRAFIAHYPDYYMPEGVTFTEDEIGVVDMGVFERLFLPELEGLARRYGPLGMHCCANARHQWPAFARIPNLRLLNLVQPPDVVREAYSFFAGSCVQMHSWCGDGDPAAWPTQLPRNIRAVLMVYAQSEQEMMELGVRMRDEEKMERDRHA